jgi:hypothetical protein
MIGVDNTVAKRKIVAKIKKSNGRQRRESQEHWQWQSEARDIGSRVDMVQVYLVPHLTILFIVVATVVNRQCQVTSSCP